jgi:hypothetical protein
MHVLLVRVSTPIDFGTDPKSKMAAIADFVCCIPCEA